MTASPDRGWSCTGTSDILLAVNGQEVKKAEDIQKALGSVHSGKEVTVEVLREGDRKTFTGNLGPNIDPQANSFEGPVHEVTLEPFFLSKYEMTQGQWRRFKGENPSYYLAGNGKRSLLNPVEQVSWEDCSKALGQLDLILPTEAQWEYGCRGGTTTVWWTGDEDESLKGKENLADQLTARSGAPSQAIWPELDDGYAFHAPVGTYGANAFGLHDLHGNVSEWCRDWLGDYRLPVRSGDGERQCAFGSGRARNRVLRGGHFRRCFRSAFRWGCSAEYRNDTLGVRPAKEVVQAEENPRLARIAKENETKTRGQAEENLVLADLKRLEQYRAEAKELRRTSPESIEGVNRWLEKAERFAVCIGKHQRSLTELREQALPDESLPDAETEQRHEMLTMLVRGLQEFTDPDPEKGTLAEIKRRLELAPTKEDYDRKWQEAIASVGNREECPKYNGLKIEVVEGLYPIGRDPESKLWEFVHLGTGGVPKRRDDGRLILTKETGLVLVLIPGGEFLMGAEFPRGPETWPEEDEVALSPFFIGKYEVRQCEWERVMSENPSRIRGESLPVETVTWHDSKAFCEKLGFALPSEAQWEYACRAGTTSPFAGTGKLDEMGWYSENSGQKTHPVGEKKPNDFGVHDMHGNVWEWCRDWYGRYSLPVRPGDGERQVASASVRARVLRGGGFSHGARLASSESRFKLTPELRLCVNGARPAKGLEP